MQGHKTGDTGICDWLLWTGKKAKNKNKQTEKNSTKSCTGTYR